MTKHIKIYDRRQASAHYLYFMVASEPVIMGGNDKAICLFKIGITGNPDSRLATIKTSCPFEIELRYIWEFATRKEAIEAERIAHEMNEDYRLSGEWFWANWANFDLVTLQ